MFSCPLEIFHFILQGPGRLDNCLDFKGQKSVSLQPQSVDDHGLWSEWMSEPQGLPPTSTPPTLSSVIGRLVAGLMGLKVMVFLLSRGWDASPILGEAEGV